MYDEPFHRIELLHIFEVILIVYHTLEGSSVSDEIDDCVDDDDGEDYVLANNSSKDQHHTYSLVEVRDFLFHGQLMNHA